MSADDKGAKLMNTLCERGWKINGNTDRFTAVYKDLTLFYDKGGIRVCYSDGTEIMRINADDLIGLTE